jgi:haloacetate dehalogenase
MGAAMFDLMSAMGYEKFRLGGHDRGGRVSYRMALDQPEKIEKLCLLDFVPTIETFERMEDDFRNAFQMWHWLFLAQPAPLPESMLERAPEQYVRHKIDLNLVNRDAITPEAMDEYIRCFSNPATIHSTCNDYRATASIDCELDEIDRRAGKRIALPTMVIMGAGKERTFEIWRKWIVDPECVCVDNCGHYVPEEGAETVIERFLEFFPG